MAEPYDTIPDMGTLGDTARIPALPGKYDASPYLPTWYQSNLINRVPETAVGWLTAQGWQVVSTYAEEDCGQTFYVMARESMNNWAILQSLLDDFQVAHNAGWNANAERYNTICTWWGEAITETREHLDRIAETSEFHIGWYISDMDASFNEVNTAIGQCRTSLDAASVELASQLESYLNTLNGLQGIFDRHELDADTLLVDLGVAQEKEINENFDNQLSQAKQDLVNRGMYSSQLITPINAKIEEERSRALTQHRDELAREKLKNEHTLYQQEFDVQKTLLTGRMQYNDANMKRYQWVIETRKNLALTMMEYYMKRMAARLDIRDRDEKLMAYQLDTRNNMAIGLWNFVERREDEYPSMEMITKLVAGLGDSGGGWITP